MADHGAVNRHQARGAARGPGVRRVSAPTRLEVLGPLVVRTRAGESRPRAAKQRRLLSVLAVHAALDRPVTAQQMLHALYGDDAPLSARRALATEIWRARQMVGAAAIVTDSDGYRLDPAHCDVDILEFEAGLTRARADLLAGDHAQAERRLSQVLGLWRGDPLPDWRSTATGRAAAGRLVELHAGARIDHAEALAALGRHEAALQLLEQLTAAEPTREHAWALLVEVATASGNHRSARAALDTARRTLAEFGVDVGAELAAARRRLGVADGPPGVTSPSPARPSLAGRADDVAALDATLREALSLERLRLALVTGEAGVGKTTVVEHVLDRSSTPVVRVHCDRRSVLPYGPIVQALRSLGSDPDHAGLVTTMLGDLSTVAPDARQAEAAGSTSAAGRTVLHEAIAEVLEAGAAARGGLVLLVEDVQWAPASTVEVLDTLFARRAAVPLAVVVTARDPGAAGARPGVEAGLRRRADTVLTLRGLDLPSTAALLGPGYDAGEVARLHRATGGNPLYLQHVRDLSFADTGLRIPSLDDAVDDHLAAVGAATAEVLALAAVIGTQVDVRVLTAAAARADEPIAPFAVAQALEEALRAGLLRRRAGSDTVSWVHEVVCSRLYANIPVARRAALHIGVAEAAERLAGGSSVPLDLVAHHYAAGWPLGSTEVTVSRLAQAGDHAAAHLDFDAAARYYRRASDFVSMDHTWSDAGRRIRLLEAEGNALLATAGLRSDSDGETDLARARSLFDTLVDLAPPDDPSARLRAAVGIARTCAPHPLPEGLLDDLAAGVTALVGAGAPPSGDRAVDTRLIAQALGEVRPYRPEQAATLLDRAVVAEPGSSGLLYAAAWTQQSGAERITIAQRLVADRTADPVAAWIRLWVSEAAAGRRAIDDPPPGRPGSGLGDDTSWWEVHAWEISAAIAGGRFARAERLLAASPRWITTSRNATEIATRASAIAGQRVRLQLVRSATGTVRSAARPVGTWVTSHPVWSHPVIRSWAAYMDAISGGPDVAAACDDLVERFHDGVITAADLPPWACATAVTALTAGHRRAAAFLCDLLRPHRGTFAIHTFTAYWGAVDHYLGRLLLLLDEPREAAEVLAAAVSQYRQAHARPYEGRAHYDLAVALWRRGGAARPDAEEHRRQAAVLLDGLGIDAAVATPWPPPPGLFQPGLSQPGLAQP